MPSKRNQPKSQNDIKTLKLRYKQYLSLLIELFPNWSQEDLLFVMDECQGDFDLAVNRISEGHASQWQVKKQKKQKPVFVERRPHKKPSKPIKQKEVKVEPSKPSWASILKGPEKKEVKEMNKEGQEKQKSVQEQETLHVQTIQEDVQKSLQEPVQEIKQEVTQEPVQEPVQDAIQEPVQESIQESMKEPIQKIMPESLQEDISKPVQEDTSEPVQEDTLEPVQEDISEPVQEDISEPVQEDISESLQEDTSEVIQEDTPKPVQKESAQGGPTKEIEVNEKEQTEVPEEKEVVTIIPERVKQHKEEKIVQVHRTVRRLNQTEAVVLPVNQSAPSTSLHVQFGSLNLSNGEEALEEKKEDVVSPVQEIPSQTTPQPTNYRETVNNTPVDNSRPMNGVPMMNNVPLQQTYLPAAYGHPMQPTQQQPVPDSYMNPYYVPHTTGYTGAEYNGYTHDTQRMGYYDPYGQSPVGTNLYREKYSNVPPPPHHHHHHPPPPPHPPLPQQHLVMTENPTPPPPPTQYSGQPYYYPYYYPHPSYQNNNYYKYPVYGGGKAYDYPPYEEYQGAVHYDRKYNPPLHSETMYKDQPNTNNVQQSQSITNGTYYPYSHQNYPSYTRHPY